MKLHADLTKRAVVESETLEWVASPLAGVWRRMLERDGAEVARATSIVRYDPQSYFDAHEHGGGEEFFVLSGTFSDEHGDYPAGSYVRNPVGSAHTPSSAEGCDILVKLRQMDPADQEYVRVDTTRDDLDWQPSGLDGLDRLTLHEFAGVRTYLARFQPGCIAADHDHPGGEEVFVLSGHLEDEDGTYPTGTWARLPAGSRHHPRSPKGCLLYVKIGHLPKP